MKLLRVLLLHAALLSLLALGCSSDDDDDNPTGPGGGSTEAVDLSAVTIDIPPAMQTAANNSNLGALQATTLLSQLNSFTIYSSWWTPIRSAPAVAQDDIFTWTVGELEIILEISESGTAVQWVVTLNGNDGQRTYNSFIAMRGTKRITGNEGNMSIYDPDNPGAADLYWEWITEPDNDFRVDLIVSETNDFITATEKPDGSGMVTYEIGNVLSFEANWASDGTGSYTMYDSQGQPQNNGTW